MLTLVIREPRQNDKFFQYRGKRLVIGRAPDSGLILPNVSVSRKHACLKIENTRVTLEDLWSENGIVVNGKSHSEKVLEEGDEFLIGRYSLVYLGIDGSNLLYKGTMIEDMPRFISNQWPQADDDSTYRFSPAMVKKLQESSRLSKGAMLVDPDGEVPAMRLGEGKYSMGKANCQIEVQDLFLGDQAAQIAWTGSNHLLTKVTTWGKVLVNGKKITEEALKEGDVLQIGRTRFEYTVRE